MKQKKEITPELELSFTPAGDQTLVSCKLPNGTLFEKAYPGNIETMTEAERQALFKLAGTEAHVAAEEARPKTAFADLIRQALGEEKK